MASGIAIVRLGFENDNAAGKLRSLVDRRSQESPDRKGVGSAAPP